MNNTVKNALLYGGILSASTCAVVHVVDKNLAKDSLDIHEKVSQSLNSPKKVPGEAEMMDGQLTDRCTNSHEVTLAPQFPMLRGTELIKTLEDGTCLEKSTIGSEEIIYAIHENKKVKFLNPNKSQKKEILALTNFGNARELSITLIDNLQKRDIKKDLSTLANYFQTDEESHLSVLVEDYMKACPENRYRRSMYYDSRIEGGNECIWDEKTMNCPWVLTDTESSYKKWQAIRANGWFIIPEPSEGDYLYADQLSPGFAPSPQEWLGNEPECPKPGSVVDINF